MSPVRSGRRLAERTAPGAPRPATHLSSPPRPPRARAQGGYTLLEVIVAFALLAAALTLLLGTLSGAARQVRGSADAGRAALHAQSLLAQVGVGEALKPGSDSGEFEGGRYRWALEIRPWADPARPPDAAQDPTALRLLELRLGIEWGDGGPRQRLLLRSLRLTPPDAEAGLQ